MWYCSGIGIVNAIEVLNAFPEEDGLLKFRKWVESPDPTILGRLDAKTGSNTRKKGLKVEDKIKSPSDENISHPQEQKELHDDIQEITQTFMDKHVIDFLLYVLSSNILADNFALHFFMLVRDFFVFCFLNREMLARIGIFLLLFQVKQLYLLIYLHMLTSQLILWRGESQIILFFASEFTCFSPCFHSPYFH